MAPQLRRPHRYSGLPQPGCVYHDLKTHRGPDETQGSESDTERVCPTRYVIITDKDTDEKIKIPQYGDEVRGMSTKYDPYHNCDGMFTASKNKFNNNCYNYAVNIATNTYAQPGRKHGYFMKDEFNADKVMDLAVEDGLIVVGGSEIGPKELADNVENYRPGQGHFVALLFAEPNLKYNFTGDYHWVRCDDYEASPFKWSQKLSHDEISNFDYQGRPISDPRYSNWICNDGTDSEYMNEREPGMHVADCVFEYVFHSWMYVPHDGNVDVV